MSASMDWKTINSFAPWFSALGTFIAAAVALYLGLRRGWARLRVTALRKRVLWPGGSTKDYLEIRAINIGAARAHVTAVDIEWGFIKKQPAVFAVDFDPTYSTKIPIELDPGQEAKYWYPWEIWLTVFTDKDFAKHPRLMVYTMKIRVWTSIGRIFYVMIPKRNRKEILKEISRARKAAKKKP
jgi:hypothetical protein